MLSISGGTKAFSDSTPNSIERNEGSQQLSAADREKLLAGHENVGELLNNIADPNHAPKKFREVGKNTLDKDDFLKLMLAQLKNQDPTNTMASHEMAAQMAQFTSLEQLQNINQGITAMSTQNASGGNYEALSFIGRVASGDSSKLFRASSDEKHLFNFDLKDNALDVKVKVKDATGEVVKLLDLKDMKKGKNSVPWNGLTEDGFKARPGEYNFEIEARASNGKKVYAETKFEGKISGVQFTQQGPILMIGDQTVKLSDVKKLIDPTLTEGQKDKESKPLDLSKTTGSGENEKNEVAGAPEQANKGNVGNLAMNRKFMQQLEKQTK